MSENDLPSAPPPSYDLSIDSPNGSAAPPIHKQTTPVSYESKATTAPPYTEPLPYPNSSGNVTSVPPIAMVDIGCREPPPGYNQEADDIGVPTFTTEPNIESFVTFQPRQHSDNSEEQRKRLRIARIRCLILIVIMNLVAAFSYFLYFVFG